MLTVVYTSAPSGINPQVTRIDHPAMKKLCAFARVLVPLSCALVIALGGAALAADKFDHDTVAASPNCEDLDLEQLRWDGASMADKPLVKLALRDGQQLRGRLVCKEDGAVRLSLPGAGIIRIDRAGIVSLGVDTTVSLDERGQLIKRDPNRTRYLYGPSAFNLGKGETYFSQKQLLFSSVAHGLTDNLTLLAGAAIPFWFADGGNGFNLIAAAKLGIPTPVESVRLAVGAETFLLPSESVQIGFFFGSATVGNDRAHATISTGYGFTYLANRNSGYHEDPPPQNLVGDGSKEEAAPAPAPEPEPTPEIDKAAAADASGAHTEPEQRDDLDLSPLIITLNGSVRLNRYAGLVTENWFFRENDEVMRINGFALRLFTEHIAVDLGVLLIKDIEIPVPWVDFTYNWF